jgi:hypothetical protein
VTAPDSRSTVNDPENAVQRGLREAALAKLRRSTELACGYPAATITRAEAHQLLTERDALLVERQQDKAALKAARPFILWAMSDTETEDFLPWADALAQVDAALVDEEETHGD